MKFSRPQERARSHAPKEATQTKKAKLESRNSESRKPKAGVSYREAGVSYRPPNPADCIDCREISAVDAMPCIRSLKSSALEAFSSAVS